MATKAKRNAGVGGKTQRSVYIYGVAKPLGFSFEEKNKPKPKASAQGRGAAVIAYLPPHYV
ncbi:Hypothetical protein I595_2383 [Croceitalea dokdonensis DOKDO 023]|uniref:Uncharacterized protein n=1 Tax=Croceitalea dokdonensis DOKDO 023 TaxID=1300341 RepID=A0A0P7AT36_9FLAO|nr:Hypothetical protein I595_2383 [Croceitalea dokdonensis DOKDO 023]